MGKSVPAGGNVDDVLAHYGVKGMHWGVRKVASTVTANKSGLSYFGNPTRKTKQAAKKEVKTKGGLHKTSEADLKKLIERMDLEKKYYGHIKGHNEQRSKGIEALGKILQVAGPILISAVASGLAVKVATGGSVRDPFRTSATVARSALGASRKVIEG